MTISTQGMMARGAIWMVMLAFADRSIGLVSTLILARILGPADFGIVAMALSFVFMLQLFSAFGFDVALIHDQKATEAHYHTAWTFNVVLGVVILLCMLAAAQPIADFYSRPEVFWVVCALAIGPLIGGLENIGVVAFRKDLDFGKEFWFQISRKFVGVSVTLPLAFWWRDYWALVAGTLAARLAGTLMSYRLHPFRPRLSLEKASSLFSFSKWIFLNNLMGFLKERMSDFAIGRLSGPAALGVYNISYEFSHLPTTEIGAPINRALLPGFARLADPGTVLLAYSNAMRVLAIVAIPSAAGLLTVAPYFVPVVLGPKWVEGVRLMEILSVSGAILMFQASICAVLIGKGHPRSVTWTNAVFVAILFSFLMALTPTYGAIGAACATLSTTTLTMPIYLYQVRRRIGLPMRVMVRAVTRPVISSCVMVLIVRFAVPTYEASMSFLHACTWLLTGVSLGIASYTAISLLLWLIAGKPDGAERLILERLRWQIARRSMRWSPDE